MKKLVGLLTCVFVSMCIVNIVEAYVIVSPGTYYYNSWNPTLKTYLETATNNEVGIASTFEDINQLLEYDALLLSTRVPWALLSLSEIQNISSYIATGRRAVLVGEHPAWLSSSQILDIVGGTLDGITDDEAFTAYIHQLTKNVDSIHIGTGGNAVGGISLFSQNVATLWGVEQNVLTVLDSGLFGVSGEWVSENFDNKQFTLNVAYWLAGQPSAPVIEEPDPIPEPIPDPSTLFLFGSGLIALAEFRRKM